MDDKQDKKKVTKFRVNRAKSFEDIYSDEVSRKNRQNQTSVYNSTALSKAAQVRDLLKKAISDKNSLVESSKELYALNPIYASVINYLANIFTWQYKVTPHRV